MNELSGRRRMVFVALGGAIVGAALATTIVVVAAESPSAARWNHTSTSGIRTAASTEASIPQDRIWQEIRVVERYGSKLAVVDNQPDGESIGDYVVFRDKLFEPNTDRQVGTIDVTCMSGFGDMCRGVARIYGKGQVVFDGMTPVDVDPDRYAIVGGTGKFADVGGVMRIEFPAEDHALLTLTLTH